MKRPEKPFYLIRHGETDWNVEGRFQGQTNIPLNDHGRSQARANGEALAKLDEDWSQFDFVASPLGRCRETMEIIRAALGLDPTGYRIEPLIIEVTFGDWEQRTLAEIAAEMPDAVDERDRIKWEFVPPNGESYAQALERVRPWFDSVSRHSVIVSHGGIIRALRHYYESLTPEDAAHVIIPQDRIYRVTGDHAGWM